MVSDPSVESGMVQKHLLELGCLARFLGSGKAVHTEHGKLYYCQEIIFLTHRIHEKESL